MTIEIYDDNPERLKRKIAQFYHIRAKRGERLMIPGKDDYIFLKIGFERDATTSLPTILNRIAQSYWDDRIFFKYDGLPEELIADRTKALKSRRLKHG